MAQGVTHDNITSTGYGESNPVADNSTAQGRSQNRRVQLVVSGDAIGVQQSDPEASSGTPNSAVSSDCCNKKKAAQCGLFAWI